MKDKSNSLKLSILSAAEGCQTMDFAPVTAATAEDSNGMFHSICVTHVDGLEAPPKDNLLGALDRPSLSSKNRHELDDDNRKSGRERQRRGRASSVPPSRGTGYISPLRSIAAANMAYGAGHPDGDRSGDEKDEMMQTSQRRIRGRSQTPQVSKSLNAISHPIREVSVVTPDSESGVPMKSHSTKRKSKIEKIHELQEEAKEIKRDNKALRSTLREVQNKLEEMQRNGSGGAGKEGVDGINPLDLLADFPDHDSIEEENAKQKAKINRLKKELAKAQLERAEALRAKEALERERDQWKDERIQHKMDLMRIQKELEAEKSETAGLQKELARSLDAAEDMEHESSNARTKNIMLNKQLTEALRKVNHMRKEIKSQKKTNKTLKEGLRIKSKELKSIKTDMEGRVDKVLALELEVESARAELSDVKSRGRHTGERTVDHDDLARARCETEKITAEMLRMQTDLVTLVVENTGLRREMGKILEKVEEMGSELTQDKSKIIQLHRELSEMRARGQDNLSKMSDVVSRSGAISASDVMSKSSSLGDMNDENQMQQSELDAVRKVLKEKISKIISLEVELEQAENRLADMSEKLNSEKENVEVQLSKDVDKLKIENKALKVKLSKMSSRNEKLETRVGEVETVRQYLEEKVGEIVGLELEVETAQEEMNEMRELHRIDLEKCEEMHKSELADLRTRNGLLERRLMKVNVEGIRSYVDEGDAAGGSGGTIASGQNPAEASEDGKGSGNLLNDKQPNGVETSSSWSSQDGNLPQAATPPVVHAKGA